MVSFPIDCLGITGPKCEVRGELDRRSRSGSPDLGLRTSDSMELLPGTLDLLILRALRWEPTHGTGVAVWLRMVTDGAIELEEGTLYPALQRLERQGLITSEWGPSEKNRRARHWQLTAGGRQRFREEVDRWERYAEVMDRVVKFGASGSIRGR